MNANMAEGGRSSKTSYEDSYYGKSVKGLTPTKALQIEALRKGDGTLALLLNSKQGDTMKAASLYAELKFADAESEMQRHIALDLHHKGVIEKQLTEGRVPEFIPLKAEREEDMETQDW